VENVALVNSIKMESSKNYEKTSIYSKNRRSSAYLKVLIRLKKPEYFLVGGYKKGPV
jgi:hypothetical protein